MARFVSPAAEELLDKPIPVLDHGFVRLVDYLGNDSRIVQAARVSYGDGTKSVREDAALIDYLLRNRHTSPFEMVELTLHVKAPIFVARQWLRHRSACLDGSARLHFDMPSGSRSDTHGPYNPYKMTIAEFHEKWHGDSSQSRGLLCPRSDARKRLERMNLRMCHEETGEIGHTRVVDVWESGTKPVFEVILDNGYKLRMSKDHRCLTARGWLSLAEATGLHRGEDGGIIWNATGTPEFAVNGIRAQQNLGWSREQRLAGPPPGVLGNDVDRPGVPVTKLMRTFAKVVDIRYVGERMTYDLEVAGPFHNFVADGFIVHNSVNEVSARYSVMPDEFYRPTPDQVRAQGKRSRQVGEGVLDDNDASFASQEFERALGSSYRAYEGLLERGVAREMAREVLPVGLYTEFYWKQDLHNLFHFLSLRLDWHAQFEIRAYGDAVAQCVKAVAPVAFGAFEEHILHGRNLSRSELEILRAVLDETRLREALQTSGLRPSWKREFLEKLGLDSKEPEDTGDQAAKGVRS